MQTGAMLPSATSVALAVYVTGVPAGPAASTTMGAGTVTFGGSKAGTITANGDSMETCPQMMFDATVAAT
jgi:hypothetical protein